ncbi:MAG: NADH-quinone oxidoreductase subunit NuoK [Deltaproteobacteria bacterium]|nr:NADH-quinone oxidoreductase subunit NuoK [Deltaproteobacteria bacterium]
MNILDWAVSLEGYLCVGAILFFLGLAAVLYRRNAIGILLGIELILNAASINFIAFSKYRAVAIDGQLVTLFIILIAAAEAAVALAIILRLYRLRETVDAGEASIMRN